MRSEKYERAIPAGMGQGGSLGGVAKECFLFRYSSPFLTCPVLFLHCVHIR